MGVHFLGLCRIKGTRDCWLELKQGLLKCEIIMYGIGPDCLCIYGFWGQRAYVYVFLVGLLM